MFILAKKNENTPKNAKEQARRVARGGNCPPNSESSTSNFQINQAFDL